MDKTEFNFHTSDYYGYSPKNMEAFRMVPAKIYRNISLLSIISTTGILSYDIIEGPYNSNSFVKCLENSLNSVDHV